MGFFTQIKEKLVGKSTKQNEKYVVGLDKSSETFSDRINELAARFREINDEYFEELENILIDYFKVSGLNVQVNVWNCAEDFMRDVPLKVKVDLLFLDIELPNYNGIYVGEYIRNDINNYAMHIIYVSSKTNYAMELFKIHPYDFIIKPIDKEKVIKNVSKLLELDEQDNNYFVYEYNRIKNKIHYGDIVYFEYVVMEQREYLLES